MKNSLSKASKYGAPNFRSVSYASFIARSAGRCTFNILDWDDSQTDLANLANAGAAGSAAGGDKLWEDNWDDDDIEEEFSTQLRFVILSRSPWHVIQTHVFLSQGGTRKDKTELGPNAALTEKLSRTAYIRIPNLVVALLSVQIIFIVLKQFLNTLDILSDGRALIEALYVPVILSAPRFLEQRKVY